MALIPQTPQARRAAGLHSANDVRRSLGLASTAPLTPPERDALRLAARAARLVADTIDDALSVNRLDLALEALRLTGTAGVAAQQLREILGRGR